MAYGTVLADAIQTSTSGGILGAGNASIMKNRIINGAMTISQYNGTSSVTPSANAYVIDRYKYIGTQASKFTFQQLTATPPTGFNYYLGATVASAVSVGSSDYFFLCQRIEGLNTYDLAWGTANAKTVTLSFQVYSSLTGTFGGAIQNGSNNYSYPFTYTISNANTWTSISVTIPGPTAGTWVIDNNSNVQVTFGLGAGSSGSGTAGLWSANTYYTATSAVSVVGTASAVWNITGVQLEVGSNATGFEYRQYGQELALCQRYFYSNVMYGTGTSSNQYPFLGVGIVQGGNSTGNLEIGVIFPVRMRVNPTVSIPVVSSGYQAFNGSGSGIIIDGSGASLYQSGSQAASVRFNFGSASSYGSIVWGNTTGAGITASAEL